MTPLSHTSPREVPAGAAADKDILVYIAEGTAGIVGQEFFDRLVERLALAFGANVGFVAEIVPEDRRRARFVACWVGGKLLDRPLEYELAGTPCAEIPDSEVVFYSEGVREGFPDDEMVVELGLDSCLAVGLRGSDGTRLGQAGVLAAGPLEPDDRTVAVLGIFAARAAAELERRRQERALRESEAAQRVLAEEQSALKRVATLVAADAPEHELLDTVANEVGELLEADITSLVRYDGARFEILAGWSRSPDRTVPRGLVVDANEATATRDALLTGRPARADDIDLNPGGSAAVRELGIRSAVAAPIKVPGLIWGAVTAASTEQRSFPAGAEKRLGNFAELVAHAIANNWAREQLAASRARIVEAGDDARRKIERDLHDGAQQRFVAATLALRLVRARVESDPAEAGRMLDEVHGELQLALNELRELAHGIHPAVLSERGLAAALGALALQASVPVTVLGLPAGRFPTVVEAASYFVVAEALANVAKHAGATSATVSAAERDDALVVEVSDDGAGGADPTHGSGLRGLDDRLDALGGSLRVESPPGGGTTLVATIPLAQPTD